jgi:hypothetical protein
MPWGHHGLGTYQCDKQHKTNKGCVVTLYGLHIYIKKVILRQKKKDENSNISTCKNYNLPSKNCIKETKILQDI